MWRDHVRFKGLCECCGHPLKWTGRRGERYVTITVRVVGSLVSKFQGIQATHSLVKTVKTKVHSSSNSRPQTCPIPFWFHKSHPIKRCTHSPSVVAQNLNQRRQPTLSCQQEADKQVNKLVKARVAAHRLVEIVHHVQRLANFCMIWVFSRTVFRSDPCLVGEVIETYRWGNLCPQPQGKPARWCVAQTYVHAL